MFRHQWCVELDSFKLCRHPRLIIAGDSLSLPCRAPINAHVGIEKKMSLSWKRCQTSAGVPALPTLLPAALPVPAGFKTQLALLRKFQGLKSAEETTQHADSQVQGTLTAGCAVPAPPSKQPTGGDEGNLTYPAFTLGIRGWECHPDSQGC